MAIKAADTLKPNSDFAIAEAEDITIKTDDGGEERLPAYLARLKTAVADTAAANAYTDQKIADLVGGAPETLDTLKEIADELAKNETAMEAITAAVQNHTHDNATTKAAGFMSAADKASLDSIDGQTVFAFVVNYVQDYALKMAQEDVEFYVGTDSDFNKGFHEHYDPEN